ncbi:helix-turn-helix domain-containing protein [Kitasatospora sp. NPDC058965]|uniref:helix-turn-helix domain-containing protein n=1 Tax=Kitasatospora sp. NPDC058965 TaxID=3346682 RepID=UPI00369BDBC4
MDIGIGTEMDEYPELVAQRVTDRLSQLDMSPAALAREAGMSTGYLDGLLRLGPAFDTTGYLRIAAALGVPIRDLLDGRADAAPGQGAPMRHPALLRLSAEECWDLLGARGVGRIAVSTPRGPGVYPVNYAVQDRTVLYRTDPRGVAAVRDGAPVSFQADHIDERNSSGWSVLLTGTADRVVLPDKVDRLRAEAPARPWAGGRRPLWIRVRPEEVSGRRILGLPGAD